MPPVSLRDFTYIWLYVTAGQCSTVTTSPDADDVCAAALLHSIAGNVTSNPAAMLTLTTNIVGVVRAQSGAYGSVANDMLGLGAMSWTLGPVHPSIAELNTLLP